MNIRPRESIRVALAAVWAHRFRSALTVLGIVIGITTVVTVASLLSGLRREVVVFFQEMGHDNIFVYRTGGGPDNFRVAAKEQRRKPILPEYAALIRQWCPSVEDAAAQLFIPTVVRGRGLTVRVPGQSTEDFSLVGAPAGFDRLTPRELEEGRHFTPEEETRAARVAVLGYDLAETLFPEGGAAGQTMLVDGAEYAVLGVYAKARGSFFGRNDTDRQVVIPLRTAALRYPQVDRYMIVAKARPGLRAEAYEEVEGILRKLRRTPAGAENDFSLSTPDQVIRQFDSITGLIVIVSMVISGLGLLVGGIGVMNIMLVSVTERTREIGIRKAVGARRSDLIAQFLMEASALTVLGGIGGIVLAIAVTALVGVLAPGLAAEVPAWALGAGLAMSASVGIFFGVWPAVKASRLDPVEALRYE